MYLLRIKVEKGKLHGPPDKFNAYVTVKVRNLKATTAPLRSNEPSWGQNYTLESNGLEKGLCVEVWDKGLIWDTRLGSLWIPMASVEPSTQEGPGQWWPLHSDVIKEGAEVSGVDGPTCHEIMLHIYYELPTEIPEDRVQSSMERPQALSTAEGRPQMVPGEEGHYTQNTIDYHEAGTEGSPEFSLGDAPTEGLVRAHPRAHSDSPTAAAGHTDQGPNTSEPRLTDTDANTASPVTSGPCATTTALSQVTAEADLSEACERGTLAASGLNVEVMTSSSGSNVDIPRPPCSQTDESTCHSPAPSGLSHAPSGISPASSGHQLERSDEDSDLTGNSASPSQVKMENAVALTNSISRRWDSVLHKLFSFAGVLRAKVYDTHSDPGFGDMEEDHKDTTASSM
ncbi:hypothetical protein AAFF_G00087790, partial [Aldrovandia affinis]